MTTRRVRAPQFFLVRHGETEGESSIRYHGRTDVPLSEPGREQMRLAARAIEARRRGPFSRIFSSPMIRAAEGARIITDGAASIVSIEEFAEVHFGLFEGLTAGEIRERYPEHFAIWNADRLAPDYTYPEGESRSGFAARVERGLDRVLSIWTPGKDGDAILVAHRGVIRAIVRKLTRQEPAVELGSFQILEFDGAWHAAALDVIGHLDNS